MDIPIGAPRVPRCGIPCFLGWLLAAAAVVAAAAATQVLRVYYVCYREPRHQRHHSFSVKVSTFSPKDGPLIYVIGLTRRARVLLVFVSVCDSFSILQLIRGNEKKEPRNPYKSGVVLFTGLLLESF